MAKITQMDTRTSTEVVILQRPERKKSIDKFSLLLEFTKQFNPFTLFPNFYWVSTFKSIKYFL